MPIEHFIDVERRRIVATVIGDFTLEDIFETIGGAVRDPRFRPGFDVYSDHRAVGEPLTGPQATQVAAFLEKHADVLAGTRWAVVTSKPASYGMLRMLSILAQRVPMEIQVFASQSEAEAWLASPRDAAPR